MESQKHSRRNSKETSLNKNLINYAYLGNKKINLFLIKNTTATSKSKSKNKAIDYINTIHKYKKNKSKETQFKANHQKAKLLDLEQMYNKIHTREVAQIINNSHRIKKQMAELINKPNSSIKDQAKLIAEYFDLSKIKEKKIFLDRTYKTNRIKENLNNEVLKNNVNSKIKEYVDLSDQKVLDKKVNEKIIERDIKKLRLKNRSKSAITDEDILSPIKNKFPRKYHSMIKNDHNLRSSLKTPKYKFDTLPSYRKEEDSFILDEKKLLKRKGKSKSRHHYTSNEEIKNKHNSEKDTRISTPNNKFTPTLSFRESFLIKCLKMTPHHAPHSLDKNFGVMTERTYKHSDIPISKNNSTNNSPIKKIVYQIPKINIEKIKENINSKNSNTDRKLNKIDKSKSNLGLNSPNLNTINYLPHENITKFKFDFNISATGRNSTKSKHYHKEDDEILKLNKKYFNKYNKLIEKAELHKKKLRLNDIWKKKEIDLIVGSSTFIEIEKLKHEYISQHNNAQSTKMEKMKILEEKFEKTKRMKFQTLTDNPVSQEPPIISADRFKTFSKADYNDIDKKKRTKNKLLYAFRHLRKNYMIIDDL